MRQRVPPTLEPSPQPPPRTDGIVVPPRRRAEPQAAPPPAAARAPRRRRGFWRWLLWLPLALAAFVLLLIVLLRWVPPPVTAFMLQSPTQPVQYAWVPRERIADVARKAAVASEDQKFYTHDGFDFEAIEKVLAENERRGRRRGASTISQQTAKNLFLWPGGGYFRKGLEAGLTVLIEKLWTKERILEVYLNIAEFGPGIYGVEAAAQAYFGKPAAALSAPEAARLIAVLPSPRRWSARHPGPYVQSRTAWILGQMGYGPRRSEPSEAPGEGVEPLLDPGLEDLPPGEQPQLRTRPLVEPSSEAFELRPLAPDREAEPPAADAGPAPAKPEAEAAPWPEFEPEPKAATEPESGETPAAEPEPDPF